MTDVFSTYRTETRGVDSVLHFNNAGAALLPSCVVDNVISYWQLEEKIGGYEAAAVEANKLGTFYELASRLINCDPKEIAFVDSATRAWDVFLYSIPFRKGDKILTSRAEFGSNVVTLQHVAERHDLELIVLDADNQEASLAEQIQTQLDDKVKLVAITSATAHSGLVQDIISIGEILRPHPAMYLVDACQSVGQMPVDVQRIGCDALVASGRKWLRGPRGTGFLYVKSDLSALMPVTLDLANTDWLTKNTKQHSRLDISPYAKRFELWERSMANQIGLTTAIEYYLQVGQNVVHQRIQELRNRIIEGLLRFSSVKSFPCENHLNGIVTFYSNNIPATEIKQSLAKHSINVSTIHDWDAPWDFELKRTPPLVRVSPHYFNTCEEIDTLFEVLSNILDEK